MFQSKDTGLNIGSNDVTVDVKVYPDKLSLRMNSLYWLVSTFKTLGPFKSQVDFCLCSVHTYESRRIIIFHSLGIAKRLQNRVSLEQLFLQLPLVDKELIRWN